MKITTERMSKLTSKNGGISASSVSFAPQKSIVRKLTCVGTLAILVSGIATGCTGGTASSIGQCGQAFDDVIPPPKSDGLYLVVSDSLAGTLNNCKDVSDWVASLQNHPEAVGKTEVPKEDVYGYLAGACNLLPESGAQNSLCKVAIDSGLFQK